MCWIISAWQQEHPVAFGVVYSYIIICLWFCSYSATPLGGDIFITIRTLQLIPLYFAPFYTQKCLFARLISPTNVTTLHIETKIVINTATKGSYSHHWILTPLTAILLFMLYHPYRLQVLYVILTVTFQKSQLLNEWGLHIFRLALMRKQPSISTSKRFYWYLTQIFKLGPVPDRTYQHSLQ